MASDSSEYLTGGVDIGGHYADPLDRDRPDPADYRDLEDPPVRGWGEPKWAAMVCPGCERRIGEGPKTGLWFVRWKGAIWHPVCRDADRAADTAKAAA